jgi:hypothetical protein
MSSLANPALGMAVYSRTRVRNWAAETSRPAGSPRRSWAGPPGVERGRSGARPVRPAACRVSPGAWQVPMRWVWAAPVIRDY